MGAGAGVVVAGVVVGTSLVGAMGAGVVVVVHNDGVVVVVLGVVVVVIDVVLLVAVVMDHEAVKPSRTTDESDINVTRIYPVSDV